MCDSNLTTNLAGRLAEAVEEAARRDRAEAVPIRFATPLALRRALGDDVVLVLFVAPPDVVAVALLLVVLLDATEGRGAQG